MLRAVLHADVRVLDPIWTTQTIANIHGMLVYDTLFGNDADMQPKPQMVDTYDITEDKLVYTFTLRDKLKFHDGSPVTTKDVIASLERWGKKDGVGQRLFSFVDKLEAVDDKTFRMALKKPYGMVLESLGKTNSSVAVIMRAQDAATDPQQQVKEAVGSGPFKFAKDQWVPGSKAVYLKNADYVPRPSSEKAAELRRLQVPGRRPHRARVDLRPADRHVGAHQRRDRFLREPEHRLLPDPGEGQGRQADADRQARFHARHDPPQPPAPALQQREGAAGHVLPDQPGGLPARHRRRPAATTASATASSPAARRSATMAAASGSRSTTPRRRCSC